MLSFFTFYFQCDVHLDQYKVIAKTFSPSVTSHQLEPVGVFWDFGNCQVTPDKSAFALANKIRKMFFEGKQEAEFMCVCDINKERKEVMWDLNKAQVCMYVCLDVCSCFGFCVFCIYIMCLFVCMYVYICVHVFINVLRLKMKRVNLLMVPEYLNTVSFWQS